MPKIWGDMERLLDALTEKLRIAIHNADTDGIPIDRLIRAYALLAKAKAEINTPEQDKIIVEYIDIADTGGE